MVPGQIMLIEAFLFVGCWNMPSPEDVSDKNLTVESWKGTPQEYFQTFNIA
jgi:hypothetical protein